MSTTFDTLARVGFWDGAAYSDEGDGHPDPIGEVDPIEAAPPVALTAVPPALVQTRVTLTAIGPVLFWDGAAYSLEGEAHPAAIVPMDNVEDQPVWLIAAMVPLASGSGGDATLPVVSAAIPATGVPLAKDAPVGFDVVDPGGNLTRSNVLAYYPSLGIFEVVYFSSSIPGTGFVAGFGPQYVGTRTPITKGFRFSDVIRRGGWPAFPVIIPDAIDAAGNENA